MKIMRFNKNDRLRVMYGEITAVARYYKKTSIPEVGSLVSAQVLQNKESKFATLKIVDVVYWHGNRNSIDIYLQYRYAKQLGYPNFILFEEVYKKTIKKLDASKVHVLVFFEVVE